MAWFLLDVTSKGKSSNFLEEDADLILRLSIDFKNHYFT